MSKERPILFSGPMVWAILEGRKTQDRRIAKLTDAGHVREPRGHRRWHPDDPEAVQACPYGQPGDRLWVREAWGLIGDEADAKPSAYHDPESWLKGSLIYRATADGYDETVQAWRPSIHMPRWASRITLDITGIRVERLQGISRDDAIAEGIESLGFDFSSPWRNYRKGKRKALNLHCSDPRRSYMTLLESLHGPGSWDANPWVWVVEFRRAAA